MAKKVEKKTKKTVGKKTEVVKKTVKKAIIKKPTPKKSTTNKAKTTTKKAAVNKSAVKKKAVKKTTAKKSSVKKAVRKPRAKVIRSKKSDALDNIPVMQEETKFIMTPQKETPTFERKASLPERYYDNRMVLLVRDPWWMYVYWDIADDKYKEIISQIPENDRNSLKQIIRVYDVTGIGDFVGSNANNYYDLEISDNIRSWYINASNAECTFCTELGFVTKAGKFYFIARSNNSNTPYYGISDNVDEEWMTLSDEQYAKVLGLESFGIDSVNGCGNGSFLNLSSAEFQDQMHERVKARLEGLVSSGGVSSEAFISNVSSETLSSSESAYSRSKKRKFFLEVYTDVIVYGRTEPDADVTFCGDSIQLKPDGTFRFRYHMPIGDYNFPVCAVSADKVDTITLEPRVTRRIKDNKPSRIDTKGFKKKSV